MQNNDLIGKVVLSKAGRDKKHFYVIIKQLDDKYVLLSNGETKTLSCPKKKKIKHLIIFDNIDDEIETAILNNDKSTDLRIKEFLKLRYIVKEG